MIEILRDQIWQFVGAVFGLVAIILTLGIFFYQRRQKLLMYQVVSNAPILTVNEEIKGRLEILFDGIPVDSARILIVRLFNSGNVPIVPGDYVRPLRFVFPENVRIIGAELLNKYPRYMDVSVEVEGQATILSPALLNSGDSVELKLLLAQSDGTFDIDSHIVGVNRIKDARTNLLKSNFLGVIGLIMMIGGAVALARNLYAIGAGLLVLGFGVFIVVLATDREYRALVWEAARLALEPSLANSVRELYRLGKKD